MTKQPSQPDQSGEIDIIATQVQPPSPTISKIDVPWESTLRTARPQPFQPDQSCEIGHSTRRYVSHCSAHEKNYPECLPCQRGQFVKDGEMPGELEDGA